MAGARRPGRLRPGDTVAVVAPAGPLVPEILEKGVSILESWGLSVKLGSCASGRHEEFDYLSGTDAERAAELQQAWCDPEVRAVFCGRGGYGAMRLLDLLDWSAMAAAGPKVLVGSSDITALHQTLGPRLDLVTIFGPMTGSKAFTDDDPAQDQLRRQLFEPENAIVLSGPDARPLIPGRARGITIGGNLSLVVSGRGVSDVPSPADLPRPGIGLLEDVSEEPYRLDHFLTHLRRAGWFERLGGLALGSWKSCGDDPVAVRAVLVDRVADLGIPVVEELGFGHCDGQLTIPLGVEVDLISAPSGSPGDSEGVAELVLTEPALE